jgi:hypothetical protein
MFTMKTRVNSDGTTVKAIQDFGMRHMQAESGETATREKERRDPCMNQWYELGRERARRHE